MLYILATIIILYTGAHFVFKKNQTFLRIRKWVDLTAVILTTITVVTWIELFHYSFFFIIYFFISLAVITYLVAKLRKLEEKKQKAEEVIKILKDEEKILEDEVQNNSLNPK